MHVVNISLPKVTCIAYFACTTFCGCGYKIEAMATRVPLAVTWDARTDYAKVTCCRFPNSEMAHEYIEARMNGGPEFDGAIVLSEPGDMITITRLTSGFNSRRLLHRFLVFEFSQRNGESEFRMVAVSDSMIESGLLDLERLPNGEAANQ